MANRCVNCNVSPEKKSRSSYILVLQNVVYCKHCYNKCCKNKYRENEYKSVIASTSGRSAAFANINNDDSSTSDIRSSISVPINRSHLDHSQCIVKYKKSESLRLLSKEECLIIYIKTDIFVKYGAHIYHSHRNGDFFSISDDFQSDSTSVLLTSINFYSQFA